MRTAAAGECLPGEEGNQKSFPFDTRRVDWGISKIRDLQ